MKRNVVRIITCAALIGMISIGYANEAQPELQPTAEGFWFKRLAETTTFNPPAQEEHKAPADHYRIITDHSPL